MNIDSIQIKSLLEAVNIYEQVIVLALKKGGIFSNIPDITATLNSLKTIQLFIEEHNPDNTKVTSDVTLN